MGVMQDMLNELCKHFGKVDNNMKHMNKELKNINEGINAMNNNINNTQQTIYIDKETGKEYKQPINEYEIWEVEKEYDRKLNDLSNMLQESYAVWADLYNDNQKILNELNKYKADKEKYDLQIIELTKQNNEQDAITMALLVQQIMPTINRLEEEYKRNSEMLATRQYENNDLQAQISNLKAERRETIARIKNENASIKHYTELKKLHDKTTIHKDMQDLQEIREYVSTLTAKSMATKAIYEDDISVKAKRINDNLSFVNAKSYIEKLQQEKLI